MKFFRFHFLISFFVLTCFDVQAQDLALHKSYILSTSPNYKYSASSSDKTSLTDGAYTSGRFWTQPTTVGWQLQGVTITIDLDTIEPVGAITFNTVRSAAVGISYPQNIFVFLSKDNKSFHYIGDVADTSSNLPGSTLVKKFELKKIDQYARYVTLTVVPEGQFIFCDEIEVIKSNNKAVGNSPMDLIPNDSIMMVADSLKSPKHNRRILMRDIGQLIESSNKNYKSSGTNKQLSEMQTELSEKVISAISLSDIKKEIGRVNANVLENIYKQPFIVEESNPWDNLNKFRVPNESSDILHYHFVMQKENVQYGSFIITNSNVSAQKFTFKITDDTAINNIELYNVQYVPSSYYLLIPDPLLKIKDSVKIDPGVSEMFIFKITGINEGAANSTITISSTGKSAQINIDSHILDVFDSGYAERLNANVWAYFNSPMIKGHEKEAGADLQQHHINTMVIPPSVLPGMGMADDTDFVNYLANFKNAKNILLFMDYSSASRRRGYKEKQYMSPEWKNNFVLWYYRMIKLIHEHCSLNAQIYLYPYDEVVSKDFEDFKKLIIWAKKIIPGVKFYATLNTQESLNTFLSFVDVAQTLPYKYGLKIPASYQSGIWIYTGNTSSRSLPPYAFYRLMSWDAFERDYKGIGFWNYADERNGGKLNLISDSLPNPMGSFSVIYNNPDGSIISSRRWEAFRLGIEDYAILKAYSKKYGVENTKAMVQQVLDHPDNLNLADSVRNKMITALIAK